MAIALSTTAIVALTVSFSLRPQLQETPWQWLGLLVPYVALAAFALHRAYKDGTLLDRLKLKGGDVTLGVLVACILLGGAWLVRQGLTPRGSPQLGWVFRILLQVGGTKQSFLVVGALFATALAEEIVWRGMVQDELSERFGTRRGWILAACAYTVALIPTVFTLSDPIAGPNPLLVLAGFGCGIFWGFMTSRAGRLPPAIISHVVFTYFAPRLLLMGF